MVTGVEVKVTSQWFNAPTSQSLPMLRAYLAKRGIAVDEIAFSTTPSHEEAEPAVSPAKGRYRGNAIGNAQNLLVRNILSRLGEEQFNAADWEVVKAELNHRCAYCGSQEKLVMEHVVSINKQALGEHRLGNLVPACNRCNMKKAAQDFRGFLQGEPDRIAIIETHMAKYGYTPMVENDPLRKIMEIAYQDVSRLADRYVEIINTLRQEGEHRID